MYKKYPYTWKILIEVFRSNRVQSCTITSRSSRKFLFYICVCACACVCRGWERGRVSKHKKGICTLGHLSQRTENLGSHKNLLMHVYSNFIHDSQTLKTTQLPFHRWMVKQVMVHPCHGILLSSKKEQTLDTRNNLRNHKGTILSEKSQSQRLCTTYLVPCTMHSWNNKLERQSLVAARVQGGREQGKQLRLWKCKTRDPREGIILGLDCGGNHTNLQMWQNEIHTQSTNKTGKLQ